jgi:soluble lytic murein transglycosylase-like protein
MIRWAYLPILLLAFSCAHAAVGDIYAYTDADGVTHFTNMPDDRRYTLLVHAAPLPAPSRSPRLATNTSWLAKSSAYDALIDGAATAQAVQPALVRAVIVIESGFNPYAVSNKGAYGLMQLRVDTARRYGVHNIFDPAQNIEAGVHYLRDLLDRYGSNMELALAAYNAGEDAVDRYGRQIPPYRETLDYVPNVLAVYHRLQSLSALRAHS